MSNDIPRHSGVLYTPADEDEPPMVAPPRWSMGSDRPLSRSSSHPKSAAAKVKSRIRRTIRWGKKRYKSMTPMQRVLGGGILIFSVTTTILTFVFHQKILHALLPFAAKMRGSKVGWLPIFALCFVSAFPPMIGYSTSVTLAGFVYGFPNGWFIVAAGTLVGATSAFLACRYFFRDFAERMVRTDKRFAALSLTLKHDGIKLLCMLRWCPLPYSISNGAISTFPTVSPWAFIFATMLATPKLFIHVFIGHRLFLLAEEDQKMDGKTKAANYGSIIGGIIFGVLTGWIIYKRALKRTRQLEREERAKLRAQQNSRGDSLEGGRFTDDPEAAATAGLISGLVEADALEGGLFSDEVEGEEDDGTTMGDETETDDDDDGMIGMGYMDHEGADDSDGK